MERTTVYLPKDLQERLRATARAEARPQAALVRDAIERYVAEVRPPGLPRFIGMGKGPIAPGIDSSNEEEWLAKHMPDPRDGPETKSSERSKRSRKGASG